MNDNNARMNFHREQALSYVKTVMDALWDVSALSGLQVTREQSAANIYHFSP